MELAESNLQEYIDSRMCKNKEKLVQNIDEDEFRDICEQLIGNLICMHNLGVVHRDIKKENILIVNNVYVLADFGVSEEISGLAQGHLPGTETFQIRSNLGGTPLYMSPAFKEAYQKHQILVSCDPFKNDIYSLGLNLLEI